MKKVYSLLTMAVIVAMSLTMTSCDGDDYWYDPYGWYDHYDDWGWSNNDWNNGWQGGSQNSDLVDMARLLTGEWYGLLLALTKKRTSGLTPMSVFSFFISCELIKNA